MLQHNFDFENFPDKIEQFGLIRTVNVDRVQRERWFQYQADQV